MEQICLELCDVHSKTVDGPKTGYVPKLKAEYFTDAQPDFMQAHNDRKSYNSNRALGHMYRQYLRIFEISPPLPINEEQPTAIGIGHPEAKKLWQYLQDEIKELKRRYNERSDLFILAGCLSAAKSDKFDRAKDLNGDLQRLIDDTKRKLSSGRDDRHFVDSCLEIANGSRNSINQAFFHLCLACGYPYEKIASVSCHHVLSEALLRNLPTKTITNMAPLVSNDDLNLLVYNRWAVLEIAVISSEFSMNIFQKITQFILEFGKNEKYFEVPPKEGFISKIIGSIMQRSPVSQINAAYEHIKNTQNILDQKDRQRLVHVHISQLLIFILYEDPKPDLLNEIKQSMKKLLNALTV